jgi:Tol biopolymer transport system component
VIDKPIGHYQIVAKIGAGGMGEVYRARDTKLGRDVAIKVLPESMTPTPHRLARFDQEAETLASLHHPNIGIVHTVVDRAIIMEFVVGEDLSVRLARGPLPLGEALRIARQITEALAAAHDAGIVHRDLKPANIKVTEGGVVKVLDFGLTAAFSQGYGGPGTQMRISDGSAPYMSPEQARGKNVDARADVWAFGCVLFEMLTGTRVFAGEEVADTIAFVLTSEPVWDKLPAATPPRVRELLRRCLIKNPHLRLRDISEARFEIDDAIAAKPFALAHTPAPAGAATIAPPPAPSTSPAAMATISAGPKPGPAYEKVAAPAHEVLAGPKPGPAYEKVAEPAHEKAAAPAPARSRSASVVLITAVLVAGVLIGGAGAWQYGLGRRPSATAAPTAVIQATLPVGPADELNSGRAYAGIGGARTALAWAPDGKTLAFVGRQGAGPSRIFIRDLGADTARPLDGTDGAENVVFSPDGREIAFASGGAIRRTPSAGGPVTKVCDARWVNGMSWGPSRFVFAAEGGLMQVAIDSGKVDRLIEPAGLERVALPQLLPGDSAVMFTQHDKRWTSGDERVMIQRLPGGTPTVLLADAADARLLPSGHIAFLRQGTLFVVEFDPAALAVNGSPHPVTKGVAQVVMSGISQDLTLAGQFAVSSTGTLAYVSSPVVTQPGTELVAVDRSGKVTPLGAGSGTYQAGGSSSRDGGRMAVSVTTHQERRPFALDMTKGTLTPLAPSGKGEFVGRAWSTSNKVAFLVYEGSKTQLVLINADNPSDVERVPDSDEFWPSAWSPDGTRLVGQRDGDLWVYSSAATPKFQAMQTTPERESHPAWSLDGKWLAYVSNNGARPEVFVRPYPGPGRAIQISSNGGTAVSWGRDGKELFFTVPGATPEVMMVASIAAPGKFGVPKRLFVAADTSLQMSCNPVNCYAVGTGKRQFVATRDVPQPPRPVQRINLILNWLETIGR